MGLDQSIILLAAAVFILVLAYSIMRSLRMPASFFEKQRQRDDLRRVLLKKKIIPDDDASETDTD
jgi:hypothetical protein